MVAFRKIPLCRAIGSPNFDWALDYGHRQEARKCWLLSQKRYFEPLIWPGERLLRPIVRFRKDLFRALNGTRKISISFQPWYRAGSAYRSWGMSLTDVRFGSKADLHCTSPCPLSPRKRTFMRAAAYCVADNPLANIANVRRPFCPIHLRADRALEVRRYFPIVGFQLKSLIE